MRSTKADALDTSNDIKSWVKSEMHSFSNSKSIEHLSSFVDNRQNSTQREEINHNETRSKSSLVLNETPSSLNNMSSYSLDAEIDLIDAIKPKSRSLLSTRKSSDDQSDLLTVLTTKSRSRYCISIFN